MAKSRSKKNIKTTNRSKSVRTNNSLSSSHKNELGILGTILGLGALHSESESAHNDEPSRTDDNIFMGGGDRSNEAAASTTSAIGRKNQRKSLDVSVLILNFMEMLNTIKIFHWSTLSYPSHIATDNLHTKMSELIDSFIEQYIGGVGGGKTPVFRGSGRNRSIPFCECKSLEHLRRKLSEYKTFLNSLTERLNGVPELLNIRDEMIGTIDQAVYLLRLK
jgi:hypothetical protein